MLPECSTDHSTISIPDSVSHTAAYVLANKISDETPDQISYLPSDEISNTNTNFCTNEISDEAPYSPSDSYSDSEADQSSNFPPDLCPH